MSKGYELTVENCEMCPFMERTMISRVADWFASRNNADTNSPPTGTCKHAAEGRPFPMGRIHIQDLKSPPEACPLKLGPTMIRLKVP